MGLWLFSPNAPNNGQLFSLGNGSDGALNVSSGTTTIDGLKQYTSVDVASGATLTCNANNGVLVILVQGEVTIAGALNLNGKGLAGGNSLWHYTSNATTIILTSSKGGGPGGGPGSNGYTAAGSGGGFGTAGTASANPGGVAYGDVDLSILHMGSGGGSSGMYAGQSAGQTFDGVAGGNGGGGLVLVAKKITVTGTISANGANGSGAGSGGMIFLVALNMVLGTNLVAATGGTSAVAGGVGRIRLDYATKIGSTNPAAHEHSGLHVGYLKQFSVSAGLGQVR